MTRREKRELANQQKTQKKKPTISVFGIKLTSVILASIMFLVAAGFFIDSLAPANPICYHRWVLSTFNGSYNSKNGPKTYMQFEMKANTETGKRATSYVWAQTAVTEGAGVNEIWLNLSDFYEDETVIKIRTGKSESYTELLKEYKLTKKELKSSKDGWIKIYDLDEGDDAHTSSSSQTFCIGFETQIRLRELAFVGNGGYDAQIRECGTSIDDMIDGETSSTEGSEVQKICDEFSTFPYAPKTED